MAVNIKAKCKAICSQGMGVFEIDNMFVFVPDTEKDKTYAIQITEKLKNIGFGKKI